MVEQGSATYITPLESFFSKYQAVTPAVEQWSLADVQWIFDPNNEGETKKDLNDFKIAKEAASTFVGRVGSLIKCQAETSALKEVLELAKKVQANINKTIKDVCTLATILVFTDLAIDKESCAEDVSEMEKYTQKSFSTDVTRNILPNKLKDMLKNLKPKSQPKKEKEKPKQNQKNEKKDKKEKAEKAEKEPKEKKRKSTASGAATSDKSRKSRK